MIHISTVFFTIGLPGSGKTTWAEEKQKTDKCYRSNRDELRLTYLGKKVGTSQKEEKAITAIQRRMVFVAIGTGKDIIIDDTNLNKKYLVDFIREISKFNNTQIVLKVFNVSKEEAIARQALRPEEDQVPAEVITKMSNKYLNKGVYEYPKELTMDGDKVVLVSDEQYFPPEEGEPAYIVDIDGTLAHNTGGRSFFDYTRVLEDSVDVNVRDVVNSLYFEGNTIIILSGRESYAKKDTEEWLKKNGVHYNHIFMRKEKDNREDSVIKKELFDNHIADVYNVKGWFDDRISVSNFVFNYGITLFRVGNPEWWF